MTAKTLLVERLGRALPSGAVEELRFTTGVNLLVGPPNAGKTKWLTILDFLLGDPGTPEDSLGRDLVAKYDSAYAEVRIAESLATLREAHTSPAQAEKADGGESRSEKESDSRSGDGITLLIERRWKEPGLRSKVIVNGAAMSDGEFSNHLLGELSIPVVHYPRGDPYAPRAWPVISWRALYRHVYRQERFWSDVADRQPDSEQHACLTQFLGLGRAVFSSQYGDLVDKQKAILALQARRDAYMDTLQQVSQDIGRFGELSVAVTPASVAAAKARLADEAKLLVARRLNILRSLASETVGAREESQAERRSVVSEVGEVLAHRRASEERLRRELAALDGRSSDLARHQTSVAAERQRLERAQVAGEVLAPLRVTHCPVCDQSVEPNRAPLGRCYLCHQPAPADQKEAFVSTRRIAFEVEQLRDEDQELGELRQALARERTVVEAALDGVREDISRLETLLMPTRAAAAAILPPDLTLVDQEAGRVNEQLRTLERIEKALGLRDSISGEIDAVAREVAGLESEIERLTQSVDYEAAGTALADGMNSYFNALNREDSTRWPEGAASVRIQGRFFEISLNHAAWRPKLGATYACFFLNAYHYGLLALSGRKGFNYPGVSILDFPPTLADGRELTDEENYLIEPFVELVMALQPVATQVIVAGRKFADLRGATRIELNEVWK